ncbi:oligopeptide/dipeptide ABC transporter ATP-binding protein [Dactylosporangium sucinum]|uniref:ABC transporter ATP-binding protein n=1 Tax=Dactylosporangium sucinum TaxID=1424081 RepID=A0A917X2G9_9ACTN|nr:oligopeptide/dipeptide ABC transporter ATP-binding protein [Dactylosporangium sucinum]GGM61887.1 ABC transporter ATP-binding protein [Dactylosporangium sucinum]
MTSTGAVLRCADVRVVFTPRGLATARADRIVAVDGVSFEVAAGRTLAVVGESGCGKSTLARALVGVQRYTGDITVAQHRGAERRRPIQLVFQDPYASLDPRRTIGFSVSEPIRAQGRHSRAETAKRVGELLELVGLDARMSARYPHEFSGGQRQRVAIARALGADPAVLVCDEATSALDVSVQAQIVNLLIDAQRAQGFAMVFVTHNLAVVRQLADDVAVMYLGRFLEVGPAAQVFAQPRHPYSEALLSAVPRTSAIVDEHRQIRLVGDPPDPRNRPDGCHFRPRCRLYQQSGEPEVCRTRSPGLLATRQQEAHLAACHVTSGPAGPGSVSGTAQ